MLIIADNRMPLEAKRNLNKLGKVFWFETKNIVYDAISGHPDIFITQLENKLIVAPNSPLNLFEFLFENNIDYIIGKKEIGNKYPNTSYYNCVINKNYIIHNYNYTDDLIKEQTKNHKLIDVSQGYCRCNCLSLNELSYICSDKGIEKKIAENNLNVLYINPKEIKLSSFKYGFIGGTCGIFDNNIVFCGKIKHQSYYQELMNFSKDFNIIELYDGPLFDVGGIFFIEH
jgi:hypothetical protein